MSRPPKFKDGEWYHVQWEDSTSPGAYGAWVDPGDISGETALIDTVGAVLGTKDNAVTLAGSQSEEQVSGVMTIPFSAIRQSSVLAW